MVKLNFFLATAAAAFMVGAPVMAQNASMTAPVNPPASTTEAPSTTDQTTPPMAPMTEPTQADNTTMPSATPAMSTDSQPKTMPAADSAQVVANAPIPDTPENRAKYGKPRSNAGKLTKATGD